jgi:hypothetical protein
MAPTPKSRPNTCTFVKPNGSHCGAHALRHSEYCFFHSPETIAARQAAREAGGRERSRKAAVLPATTPDQPLDSASDVLEMLTVTANQVRRGEIDAKIGSNIGYLCGVALTAMKQGHLENRMRRLEEIIAAQDISIDPEPVEFVNPTNKKDDEDYDDEVDEEYDADEGIPDREEDEGGESEVDGVVPDAKDGTEINPEEGSGREGQQ